MVERLNLLRQRDFPSRANGLARTCGKREKPWDVKKLRDCVGSVGRFKKNMTTQLIRASVQGIVFLVDSAKGRVYTNNPARPVYVGDLERIPEEDKHSISKTNGCMATARVRYRADIRDIMASERLHAKNEAIGSPASPVCPTTPTSN